MISQTGYMTEPSLAGGIGAGYEDHDTTNVSILGDTGRFRKANDPVMGLCMGRWVHGYDQDTMLVSPEESSP